MGGVRPSGRWQPPAPRCWASRTGATSALPARRACLLLSDLSLLSREVFRGGPVPQGSKLCQGPQSQAVLKAVAVCDLLCCMPRNCGLQHDHSHLGMTPEQDSKALWQSGCCCCPLIHSSPAACS